MSVAKVRSALVSGYVAGAFFSKANTAYENMAFTPPTGAAWCQVNFVPAEPVVATLGAGGSDRLDGFIQFDLNYPMNTGEKAATDKADSFRNVFKAGARFAYSGQEVIIASCGRSQGRIVKGSYRISVTVVFYAHITRN